MSERGKRKLRLDEPNVPQAGIITQQEDQLQVGECFVFLCNKNNTN
jgi:hypothetical protein